MAAGNTDSFLHVSRPEIDLPADVDPYADAVYEQGRLNLADFLRRGVLVPDEAPCFYVYRQRMGATTQTGVVCCASVDDYANGVIKKHELTRVDKENDRVRHIDALDAHDEPVFLLSRRSADVEAVVATVTAGVPTYDFETSDGVRHTLWVVADGAKVARLVVAFAEIPNLYVADGHHRSAAALRLRDLRRAANRDHTGGEEYNAFLAVVFADDQLNIMAYNRVVADLAGMSAAEFTSALEEWFDIEPSVSAVEPLARHEFGMYLEGAWSLLRARPGVVDESDVRGRLDVSVLQERVLGPLLGIEDPRTDKRIRFVGGIRGTAELKRLVDAGEGAVAFSMHPTSTGELIDLADRDEIMPPKSTWFEPKLRSGLFVHALR